MTGGRQGNGTWLFAQECGFVAGADKLDILPAPGLPEVAFAGRSNVGKSSLLNALTGQETAIVTDIAVPLQLQHVLAGEGVRCAETDQHTLIDQVPVRIPEGSQGSLPFRRKTPHNPLGDRLSPRPAQTDDPDGSGPRRRGPGDDRVVLDVHTAPPGSAVGFRRLAQDDPVDVPLLPDPEEPAHHPVEHKPARHHAAKEE